MAGDSDSGAISSPDGRYLGWIGDGFRIWDVTSGQEISSPASVLSRTAEFLNDGRLAFVADNHLVLRQLPDEPQQVLSLPEPKTHFIGDIGISEEQFWLKVRKDGLLVAGSRGSKAVVWDPSTKAFRKVTSPRLASASSLQWSSRGIIAWTEVGSGTRGWDDRLAKPVIVAGANGDAANFAFRSDGVRLAVVGFSSVSLVDFQSRRAIATWRDEPAVETGIAFSPDGSSLAFSTSSNALMLFDGNLRPQRTIAKLEDSTSAEHVAFSFDGRWIAAGLGGPHTALRVWPAAGSEKAVTLDSSRVTYGPQPPAFSRDSRWLASFKKGKFLTIWSTASWDVQRTWTLLGTGRALQFAPDGTRLAIAADGEAGIWDPGTGQKLVSFSSPGSAETDEIAWSPDGRRVVTSADDGVLRFWNSSDGRLLASLYLLADGVNWLLVTPDGRMDGSNQALEDLVAWRVGDRVILAKNLTQQHRVQGLWQSLVRQAH